MKKRLKMFKVAFSRFTLLKRFVKWLRGERYYWIHRNEKMTQENKILLLGSPEHDNLGDHAIALAERRFLADVFPEYKIIELSHEMFWKTKRYYKHKLTENDIIALAGGGDLGNEYTWVENVRRAAIKAFPKNKIFIFPQTVYFTDDSKGKRQLEKSIKIYGKHQRLCISAREKVSYDFLKSNFTNNTVKLFPDIVLSLNFSQDSFQREGALIVLRNDRESALSDKEKADISELMKSKCGFVRYTDTNADKWLSFEERGSELERKLSEFKKSKIVVTDRLHGMIFSAITATPCIAISNYNQKVAGVYEWIKYLPYVRYAEKLSDIQEVIKSIDTEAKYCFDTSVLNEYFWDMRNFLINF